MKRLIFTLIKAYRLVLSPYFGGQCRFYPSCSEYAIQAIEKHGVLKGSLKSAGRILRCNPLNKGGIDNP